MGEMPTELKRCTKCGEDKPATLEFFAKNPKGKMGLNPRCRVCTNEYIREWNKTHPESCRVSATKYRKKNLDKFREWSKKSYQRNKEKAKQRGRVYYLKNHNRKLEYQREYRLKNKESVNEANRRWRENNREYDLQKKKQYTLEHYEQYRARIKEWQQKNKDKKNAYWHSREAQKKNLPATLSVEQWEECKKFFNYKCAYCGENSEELTKDHFVALSNGGEFSINNIIPCCRSCNSIKRNSDFFDWYPRQLIYSRTREKKILKYLGYKDKIQQLSLM